MISLFYINLDKMTERKVFMESHFCELGLIDIVERFSAVDATAY